MKKASVFLRIVLGVIVFAGIVAQLLSPEFRSFLLNMLTCLGIILLVPLVIKGRLSWPFKNEPWIGKNNKKQKIEE